MSLKKGDLVIRHVASVFAKSGKPFKTTVEVVAKVTPAGFVYLKGRAGLFGDKYRGPDFPMQLARRSDQYRTWIVPHTGGEG